MRCFILQIKLSDHFTYKTLLKFTLPSVVMMVFISIYGVVDGFFVSNFVGKIPFAAVNFITPFLMILGAFGFMFGAGGSALIARTMGQGDTPKANRQFSLFVYVSLALSFVLAALGIIFIRSIASLLGAEGELLENCVLYGRIILVALPALMMQFEFQTFFVTAEKPQLGLYSTIAAGITNIVLDALLVAVFSFGLVGAALATAISQVVGGVIPMVYFSRPNTSLLRLGATDFDVKSLLKGCANGSSELLSNISMSLVGMLYNVQLMKYAGENGVAAYGVMMYVNFVFLSMFIGYSVGTAPVVSYHYGAGNTDELKGILKRSLLMVSVTSIVMFATAQLLAKPLSAMFVGYDQELMQMTQHGFRIFAVLFIFVGIGIFGSGFFTALNNGLVSAIIAFLRTIGLQVAAVLLFPMIWGIDGIWGSVAFAECVSTIVTIIFLLALRKKYRY